MASSPELTRVGTYASGEEAKAARDHLRDAAIDPVEISQVADDVWEVEAPVAQHDRAVRELASVEQHRTNRY